MVRTGKGRDGEKEDSNTGGTSRKPTGRRPVDQGMGKRLANLMENGATIQAPAKKCREWGRGDGSLNACEDTEPS